MSDSGANLRRELGVGSASLLGLGSILGTGVFVSIGLAAGVAGPGVIIAVLLAAVIATFNGLSSAQLAAAHPVSGGTYEYGHEFLTPTFGFAAGWMFLTAKSASAATAALGVVGYALHALDLSTGRWQHALLAFGCTAVVTALVASGLRRSNRVNAIVVAVTITALIAFVVSSVPNATSSFLDNVGIDSLSITEIFGATALMFVAFAGYGRVATLSEEVRDPRRTIPRAVVATLAISALIYLAVAVVAVAAVSAAGLAISTNESAAPLELAAETLGNMTIAKVVAVGAVTAMLGVLLNLVLGLSRVLLAMARRGDMPSPLALISKSSPTRAVIAVGALIAGLTLIGDIRLTWSLSAFTVLVYYAITNLAALRLPPEKRFLPRWISALGLASCLFIAFWVPVKVWLVGLAVLALGFVWRFVFRRLSDKPDQT